MPFSPKLISRSPLILLLFLVSVAGAQQNSLSSLYQQAKASEAAGDYKSATEAYEQILRLRPDMAEAYANAGNLYYLQGQTERAETYFRKAISLKPSLAGPHFLLGVLSFTSHDYASAIKFLNEAQRLDPANSRIQSYLGYTQFALRNYRQAAVHLEKAAQAEPGSVDVFYHLGKAYGKLAAEHYADLERQFPDSLYSLLAQAHVYEAQQNWDLTAKAYERAAALNPAYPHLQEKLKEIAARKPDQGLSSDRSDAATRDVDGALALFYNPPANDKLLGILSQYEARLHDSLNNRITSAEQLYEAAEDEEALSYLAAQWVFDIDPDSYRARQIKAQYYEESGDDTKAIDEYKKAARINPQLPNIHFLIGNLYWKREQMDNAFPELQTELKSDPNHPEALYELGDISLARNQLAQAQTYFFQALKVEPRMKEAHLALARHFH